MTATIGLIRQLALLEPSAPVLSVYLRTDPRDPANTAHTPGWLVALRNGLRGLDAAEADAARDERLALRALRERVEADIPAAGPAERGRGIAWFLTPDGALDRRLALQLPPRESLVRWDGRPFISPLVDVADRGRPTGLVLVGGDAVRLLHWEAGAVTEPARSLYELELGDWREYGGSAAGRPAHRGPSPVEGFENRVEDWRNRFLVEAARATATHLGALGWERLLLAGDPHLTDRFAQALPDPVRQRLVATAGVQLLWEEPAAAGERLDDELDAAWRRDSRALAEEAIEAVMSSGQGAVGWTEVLHSLFEHRVEHLIFAADARPDRSGLPRQIVETQIGRAHV